MKKVIISACLLGEYCRYDGQTKKIDTIIESFKDYEIIPFCPEAPVFGTPRERISIVEIDGIQKVMSDEKNQDVTSLLKNEIKSFIKKNLHVDGIVLKSKSPSCGLGTTPILDVDKNILKYGDGLATEMLKTHFKDIEIVDENNFGECKSKLK